VRRVSPFVFVRVVELRQLTKLLGDLLLCGFDEWSGPESVDYVQGETWREVKDSECIWFTWLGLDYTVANKNTGQEEE